MSFEIKKLKDERAVVLEKMEGLTKKAEKARLSDAENVTLKSFVEQYEDLSAYIRMAEKGEQHLISNMPSLNRAAVNSNFGDAFREVYGGKKSHKFKVDNMRAVLTSDGSGTSGSNTLYQGTEPEIVLQPDSDTAILGEMTMHSNVRNGQRFPFVDRDDRFSSQQQATQITQLTQQAAAVSSFTVDFKNFYTLVAIHNDVIRDAQDSGQLESMIGTVSRQAIQKDVLTMILDGTGTGTEFTGLQNYSGVQTITTGGTAPTNDTIFDDFSKAKALIELKNGNFGNASILWNPHIGYLHDVLVDTTKQFIQVPPSLEMLWAKRYSSTVVSATDGGVGGSKVFVGDFSNVHLFGDVTYEMRLDERYADYDQTAFLLVYRIDMRMFDPEQMVIINGWRKTALT